MPVIVAEVGEADATVVTVNVALIAPNGTVTELGTVADGELLVRLTTFPPSGASKDRVTVPVEVEPPTTDVGDRDTEDKVWPFAISGTKSVRSANRNVLAKLTEKIRLRVGILQTGHIR